jgi:hypothetical protein
MDRARNFSGLASAVAAARGPVTQKVPGYAFFTVVRALSTMEQNVGPVYKFRENADLPANDNVPFEQRREDDGIPANDNVPGGQRQEDPDLPANDNVPPKDRDDEDRDR